MEHLFSDGSLSFIGQDVECVPPWLASKYGATANRVDLSYNRLRSVKGLVGFTVLKELILDNNQLSDSVSFPKISTLETLTINKNNITDLSTFLEKLKQQLPNLTYLSMLGNNACPNQIINLDNDEEDYQRYSDEERKEALRIGAYMKVITSDTTATSTQPESETSIKSKEGEDLYTPLPASPTSRDGTHKSSFGKCRYVYYGKHSEGNRFIVNNDL